MPLWVALIASDGPTDAEWNGLHMHFCPWTLWLGKGSVQAGMNDVQLCFGCGGRGSYHVIDHV